MNTDTPRTYALPNDAIYDRTIWYHAQKLERENNELKAKLHSLMLICGTTDEEKLKTWVDRNKEQLEAWKSCAEELADYVQHASVCKHKDKVWYSASNTFFQNGICDCGLIDVLANFNNLKGGADK